MGHRLEIIIDHQLESAASADAILPIITLSWTVRSGMHVSLLILVYGSMFTSSFNYTAQELNSTFTRHLYVLYFRDWVAYVKHFINKLFCFLFVCCFLSFFFFADSNILIIKKKKTKHREKTYLWCFKMLFKTLCKFKTTHMVQWFRKN